jgi:hypothetical protein
MMIKGGIRIGGLSRISGFDADAVAYFERAGVTDATAKSQISAFVIGVKDLGLWSSIVTWPFRQNQNPSAVATAYSLGGLGTFNASCQGSPAPTLSADGVAFNGTSNFYSTSFDSAGVNSFCCFAGTCPTVGGLGGSMFGANNSSAQNIFWLNPKTGFGGEFRFSGSNASLAENALTNNHFWLSRGVSSSATRVYVDGSLSATAGGSSTTPSPLTLSTGLQIGRQSAGFGGVLAFAMVGIVDISSPSDLYNLYKNTIGTGLGLP